MVCSKFTSSSSSFPPSVNTIELGLSDADSREDLGFIRLQLELCDLPTSPEEEEEVIESSQVTQKEVRVGWC